MIVLAPGAIKHLLDNGRVDVWAPQVQVLTCPRCGARMPREPRCPRCHFAGDGVLDVVRPQLTAVHVVRRRSQGKAITYARALGAWVNLGEGEAARSVWRPQSPRAAALQDLTYPEALAAGFRTRDDFYTWWRERYATGPLMERIDCWVTTYEQVGADAEHYLSGVIDPGRQGDYTQNRHQAIDDLPVVDAAEWAEKAEQDRLRDVAHEKLLWRMRRRRRKAA